MSGNKYIIFFTDNSESDDVKKLHQIISDNNEWSERSLVSGVVHYYSLGGEFTWFNDPKNWVYFGIGVGWSYPIDKTFKDFKIVCAMDEEVDYDKPDMFQKKTIDAFKIISEKMGDNNIYAVVFNYSLVDGSGGLMYHKILDSWEGNFYDKGKNRDKKLKEIGI